jgi:hypothetical protein
MVEERLVDEEAPTDGLVADDDVGTVVTDDDGTGELDPGGGLDAGGELDGGRVLEGATDGDGLEATDEATLDDEAGGIVVDVAVVTVNEEGGATTVELLDELELLISSCAV